MTLDEELQVTFAMIGQDVAPLIVTAFTQELARYPPAQISAALRRCREQVRGRLTLADVLDRLPDGHLGPEEAWALVQPSLDSEAESVVWTDQIAEAYFVARALRDDRVAARLAFREKYAQVLRQARAQAIPPRWWVSLGWEKTAREGVIHDAVAKGRLTSQAATRLLPYQHEAAGAELGVLVKSVPS